MSYRLRVAVMGTVYMTVALYNMLKACQRKSEGSIRYALVNGQWKRVFFV